MNLQHRIDLLVQLGDYISSNDDQWLAAKEKASYENSWFIPQFVDHAVKNIANNFLQENKLAKWTADYQTPEETEGIKSIGIVMAGNIPLVGFHDLLCVFISGHKSIVKLSSKDSVLLKHLVEKLMEWDNEISDLIVFADNLKGCDAYIATGSNNTAGYFNYYFGKYPNIIRRNKTSVAVISGNETKEQLEDLADDVFLYFGLGCRNVTKIYVPTGYDFIPLLTAFSKYEYLADHHKYKNNYDYNLAIHILNNRYYMSTPAIILAEEKSVFSPISQLNYSFFESENELVRSLKNKEELQCIVGNAEGLVSFGSSQSPKLENYADGIDTLNFVSRL